MTIQIYPLIAVFDNPWNERPLDQENVDKIAASIKADSMLQPPVGRIHPEHPGQVQLAFGHHRLAAFRQLQAAESPTSDTWKVIPVDVREIDDRTMARYAIVENHHRADPSAIEVARALVRLTSELHMTQAEAGQLVGLKTQSAVSHLTALLELPADVQKLVHEGQISQVAARALLPLMHFQPAAVGKIAKAALEEDADDRTEAVRGEIENLLRRSAQSLSDWERPWPIEWPDKPLAIDDNRKEKGEPSEIPACRGCKFAVVRGSAAYCLRKPCFDAKHRAWLRTEVDKASAKLGIPAAKPGETVSVVFNGSYYNADAQKAAKLVRSKLPELRLAPNTGRGTESGLIDVTGSKSVILVTTSKMNVEKFLKESKGKAVAVAKPANETPAQAEKRKVAEQELREERALERIQFNRSKADILWLVEHAAELIGGKSVAGGGMLAFAIRQTERHYLVSNDDFKAAAESLAGRAKFEARNFTSDEDYGGLARSSTPEVDALRRQYLAYRLLASTITGYKNSATIFGDLKGARKDCLDTAKDFGIDLPEGWDVPPIHHTPINCWECGRFSAAGGGKLTQGDLKEGWITKPDGSVRCPEHRAPNLAETLTQDRPPVTRREHARERITRSLIKGKSPATAARQATQAAVALASKPNVHGHARPAPKPSAKKTTRRKTAKKGK